MCLFIHPIVSDVILLNSNVTLLFQSDSVPLICQEQDKTLFHPQPCFLGVYSWSGHATAKPGKQTTRPEALDLTLEVSGPSGSRWFRSGLLCRRGVLSQSWLSGAALGALSSAAVCCVWLPAPPLVFLIDGLVGAVLDRSWNSPRCHFGSWPQKRRIHSSVCNLKIVQAQQLPPPVLSLSPPSRERKTASVSRYSSRGPVDPPPNPPSLSVEEAPVLTPDPLV